MRRDLKWKLVWYLGDAHGELYRIDEDPQEAMNLWNKPEHHKTRCELVDELRDWLVSSMLASRSRPTKAPQKPMHV